jgi:hypothetical protein
VQFYRVYHTDRRGEITCLTNFSEANDASACEQAVALMAQHKSPGAELWEGARRVHCAALTQPEPDYADDITASLGGFPAAVGIAL